MAHPTVLAWSGGKDSTLALQALRSDPAFDVVALLTTVTRDYDRISMHGVRRSLLHAQAASLGLPLVEAWIPAKADNATYEGAMRGALAEIRVRFPRVGHLAFGDLFLADVRAYRERNLEGSGFLPVFPIWGQDTRTLASRFVSDGFEAIVVCVDSQQIPESFAGRLFDDGFLAELPGGADPCGENGEFHTFVAGGPLFTWPIPYERGEIVVREQRFVYCDLVPAAKT